MPVKDRDARDRFDRRRRAAESSLPSSKAELAALTVRSRHSELDKLHSGDRSACDAFLAAPPHLKVRVLRELIERVVLTPAPRSKWHPDRVEIRWARF